MNTPTFTPSQLTDMRVACAESAGWTPAEVGLSMGPDQDELALEAVPDYPTDRNAMVKLIAGLSENEQHFFQTCLISQIKPQFYISWSAITAPVVILCKCYLQTKWLWDSLVEKWLKEKAG